MMAWKVPGVSEDGNELIEIYFPEWEEKYGVKTFTVDMKTGQMYIFKNNKLQRIEECCSTKPIVGQEIMSITPSTGLGFGKLIVETPGSLSFKRTTPPPAESTRKLKGEGVEQPMGRSYLEGTHDHTEISFKPKTLYVEEWEEGNKLGDNPNQAHTSQGEYTSRSDKGTDIEMSHTNLMSELSQHCISSTSVGEELEGELLFKTNEIDSPDLSGNKMEQKMAREAADRAAKMLAKSLAEEAKKKIESIGDESDQSPLKRHTQAVQEAVAEQARLAKEAAIIRREVEKTAQNKKLKEQVAYKRQKEEEQLATKLTAQAQAQKLKAEQERQKQFEYEQAQLVKERKLEEEQRKRDIERAYLLQEREMVRIQRLQILEKEIQLYTEGKRDLRKNLLNRRLEQVSQGRETF